MKLVVAVVNADDAEHLIDALMEKAFRLTRLPSSGGFLKGPNDTLYIGVEDHQVETVLDLIKLNCKSRKQSISPPAPGTESPGFFMPYPVEVNVGGAAVFILDVERFEKC